MKYDILFTASTYRSVQNAIRFANSIKYIDGNHLCIISGYLEEDTKEIAKETDAITFVSKINSLYLGRAWGFVWAINSGVEFKYLCSCDDDLEFTENSSDIVAELDKASEYGFSVLAFQNFHHEYLHKHIEGKFYTHPPWINGDCMYSHAKDNMKFGLPDCSLDTPVMYYSEAEYQQRMQVMTGKPIIVPSIQDKYIHHFRTDPVIAALRAETFMHGHVAGLEVWKKKHGHTMTKCSWKQLDEAFIAVEKSKNIEHIMFDGQTNNWKEIYNSLSRGFYG